MTSAGGKNSTGRNGDDDAEQIVQLIDKATKLAASGKHTFLVYLLDMARIEACEVARRTKQ